MATIRGRRGRALAAVGSALACFTVVACAQSVEGGPDGSAQDSGSLAEAATDSGGADTTTSDTRPPTDAPVVDAVADTLVVDAGVDGPIVDATLDAPTEAALEAGVACSAGSAVCGTTCCPDSLDLGIYNWNVDTTSWSTALGVDILNWGAARVTAEQSSSIRIYLGVNDIYQLNGGTAFATPLAAAQTAAYAKLFSNPSLSTYFLTTYTASDQTNDWFMGYTAAQTQAETTAIQAVASYLAQTYPKKTFAFMNWEGDNAISSVVGSSTAWAGFLSWTQARIAGVRQAQAANSQVASHLAVGLEFNYTVYPVGNGTSVPCGTGASNSCVVSRVAPNVAADFYSYSSWQSLAGPEPQLGTQLAGDLGTALVWIRGGQPSTKPSQMVVGELGSARDIWGECPAAQRVADALTAIKGFGSSYAFFWQAGDNPASTGPYVGFGLSKYDGSSAMAAKVIQSFIMSGTPTVPSTGCNTINAGGVVNGLDYTTHIPQGSVVAIFGASFAGTADVVHLWANGMRYTIAAGSPNWYDSAGQINATLPTGVVSTEAVVYVTSGSDVDSNGQLITISAQ
jgi:hypothetical protein